MGRGYWSMPPTQSVKTADGVTIAYEDAGSGPPVVFVHGVTDDRQIWDGTVDRLADNHRCVRLDLRGHGESGDASDYAAFSMAADITAVVEATGLERPALVG